MEKSTMSKDSFLTPRQLQILELRKDGMSQADIARKLGTTRANISATERTARMNVQKAENTLKLSRMIGAAVLIKIDKDTDLNEVPKRIYEKGGREEIWINLDTPSLVGLIKEECKNKIKGRRIIGEIEIAITKEGDIIAR
jgi:Tfx family DNA-binding protein